jgi:hypothetical protein
MTEEKATTTEGQKPIVPAATSSSNPPPVPPKEEEESPEWNISFIGAKDGIEPEASLQNGMDKRIIMPPAEEQLKPGFYHEKASDIIAISPYYKAFKPKGKK